MNTGQFRFFKAIWSISLVLVGTVMVISCGSKRYVQKSSSMQPTIQPRQEVTVDLHAYRSASPKRWEIVCYKRVSNSPHQYLGRVIGLPGETVLLSAAGILVDGKKLTLPSTLLGISYNNSIIDAPYAVKTPLSISNRGYFILGDNTSLANDCRFLGEVLASNIVGRVTVVHPMTKGSKKSMTTPNPNGNRGNQGRSAEAMNNSE